MSEPRVILKKRRAKPLHLHHPWVLSGAVESVTGDPSKGGVVAVHDAAGRFIGRGDFNADSQLLVRLFSWDEQEVVDEEFWRRRLLAAARLRTQVLGLPAQRDAYRLVHSEGDQLPGLLVDRYGDWLVAQFRTAGMAGRRELIGRLLVEASDCPNVYELPDPESARLERLPPRAGVLAGTEPPPRLIVHEGELQFAADVYQGQKTGLFLDQAENHVAAGSYAAGRAVLDAYAYSGGFGMRAARRGADQVLLLDSSEAACALARENLQLNGIAGATVKRADVNAELRELKRAGRRFGMIVLDPPRFARSAASLPRALRAYHDVNLLAMQLLEAEGILVSCSCSQRVSPQEFLRMLNGAAVEARRMLQILEMRGQAPDHPAAANCPETAYLKCCIARVC